MEGKGSTGGPRETNTFTKKYIASKPNRWDDRNDTF